MGSKFKFQYFWGFQNNHYFWGTKKNVDISGGSSQNWNIFKGHFYAFYGLFLRLRYRMGIFVWVAKISNIFLGWLKFLIFLGGER